jgi:hypothetical protein
LIGSRNTDFSYATFNRTFLNMPPNADRSSAKTVLPEASLPDQQQAQ